MEKFSKEQLWGQIVSDTPAGQESLTPTGSDDPIAEKGVSPEDTGQHQPTAPKLSVPQLKKEAVPSGELNRTVTPTRTQSCTTQGPPKTTPAEPDPKDFTLDRAERLPIESFPHQPKNKSENIPTTIPNLEYLLNAYQINVRYNVIKKKLQIIIPGMVGSSDNLDNAALSHVISLATLNTMNVGQIPNFLEAIGNRRLYNPVAEYIKSEPWDGIDRLQDLYDTLKVREDFPEPLKCRLIERWLISAAAAALMPSGFRSRGVLTLVGSQSLGKTTWIANLVQDHNFRDSFIKLDHHLDAGSKDSLITAISHWIVEIGELESSFKRDVARLKGFITAEMDKVRRPYGRGDSEYARRTVFCATVNDDQFLVDTTGNTRFWTIPVTKINYNHGIDMQQLWAQVATMYENGEPWWLTQDEERCLEEYNKHHVVVDSVAERVMLILDLSRKGEDGLPAMTATEVLERAGYANPTNPQQKSCNAILRRELGPSKRINGFNKWRVPFIKEPTFHKFPVRDDSDEEGY